MSRHNRFKRLFGTVETFGINAPSAIISKNTFVDTAVLTGTAVIARTIETIGQNRISETIESASLEIEALTFWRIHNVNWVDKSPKKHFFQRNLEVQQ